jgi:hypothetical protein
MSHRSVDDLRGEEAELFRELDERRGVGVGQTSDWAYFVVARR